MQNKTTYFNELITLECPDDFPMAVDTVYHYPINKTKIMHIHNILEIGYCHNGSGSYRVENKCLHFNSGDIMFITPSEYHLAILEAKSKWTWLNINIDKLLLPYTNNYQLLNLSAFKGEQFKNIIPAVKCSTLCSLIKSIISEYLNKGNFYKENIRSLLTLFLSNMHRQFSNQPAGIPRSLNHIQRVENAIIHISKYYNKSLQIDSLAKRCNLSPTHFRRLFKEALGKSPQDYINEVRIIMACAQLKNKNQPITQIAFDCGFQTLSSFNRQFKKQMATSPRNWQKQV